MSIAEVLNRNEKKKQNPLQFQILLYISQSVEDVSNFLVCFTKDNP